MQGLKTNLTKMAKQRIKIFTYLLKKSVQRNRATSTSGLVDADLGCGLIKQRIAKAGKGRSGGYRVLIAYRFADIAIFIYGFSKNEKDNIEQDELASFQEIAGNFLKYKDESIQNAIKSGFLYEVNNYGKEKK